METTEIPVKPTAKWADEHAAELTYEQLVIAAQRGGYYKIGRRGPLGGVTKVKAAFQREFDRRRKQETK